MGHVSLLLLPHVDHQLSHRRGRDLAVGVHVSWASFRFVFALIFLSGTRKVMSGVWTSLFFEPSPERVQADELLDNRRYAGNWDVQPREERDWIIKQTQSKVLYLVLQQGTAISDRCKNSLSGRFTLFRHSHLLLIGEERDPSTVFSGIAPYRRDVRPSTEFPAFFIINRDTGQPLLRAYRTSAALRTAYRWVSKGNYRSTLRDSRFIRLCHLASAQNNLSSL